MTTARTEQRSVGNDLFQLQDELGNDICDQDNDPIYVKWVFTPGDTEWIDERD